MMPCVTFSILTDFRLNYGDTNNYQQKCNSTETMIEQLDDVAA